jgi:hypothetical protein
MNVSLKTMCSLKNSHKTTSLLFPAKDHSIIYLMVIMIGAKDSDIRKKRNREYMRRTWGSEAAAEKRKEEAIRRAKHRDEESIDSRSKRIARMRTKNVMYSTLEREQDNGNPTGIDDDDNEDGRKPAAVEDIHLDQSFTETTSVLGSTSDCSTINGSLQRRRALCKERVRRKRLREAAERRRQNENIREIMGHLLFVRSVHLPRKYPLCPPKVRHTLRHVFSPGSDKHGLSGEST